MTIMTVSGCGCQIKRVGMNQYDMEYCPKHEAADDMYAALEDIIEQAEKSLLPLGADLADSIRVFGKQAVAEAEGVKE